jgi:hypothetical protein
MGQLPDTLPIFLLPDIPLNLETLDYFALFTGISSRRFA